MRNILRLLVIGIVGMAMLSCRTDEIVPVVPDNGSTDVGVYGDQIKLRLNVVAPDPIRVNTRAVDPDGKGIQTMTLFCFDQYGLFISTASASLTPDPSNDETGGIFDAFIPNTTRVIHLVGNQNMTPFREDDFRQKTEDEVLSILEGSAGMLIYWARVEVPANVQELYTEVKDEAGNTIQGRSVADAILDWITIETNPEAQKHRGVEGKGYPIVMLRNQARVTVVSRDDANTDGKGWNGTYFIVTGFTVLNTKAFGTVAPYNRDHRFPTYTASTFTPTYSVDKWEKEQYITLPENREILSDIMDVDTAEETYVFETENSSADPVDVIIKGKNVINGVEQEELYYKVNIVDENGEQVLIRRNHHYEINIVGNLNYGSPNFGESLDAPATNNIWLSISDEVNSVMNSDYVLTVDKTKVVVNDADISQSPTLNLTFSVTPNRTGASLDQSNLSVSWIEENQTVSSTHNHELNGSNVSFNTTTGAGVITLALNRLQSGLEFDKGTILVKYGHLQRKIRVVIVRTQKFIPAWVSTEVYGVVTGDKESRQNVSVIFSIPEDCPAELFPMDVLITANNLDVRSQSGQVLPIVRRGEDGYGQIFNTAADDGTEVNDVGYKYVFTVTEPGMQRLYLENILASSDRGKEYITLEAENFELLTKIATFVAHQNKLVLPKLKSYEYNPLGGSEADVIHYMLVPQKRYAPVTFDLSTQTADGSSLSTITEDTEFVLHSSNLDHYEDDDTRLTAEQKNAFDCYFVPYDKSNWSTGGRVYGFYPRTDNVLTPEEIGDKTYYLFQIYLETNKANSAEIVRVASNLKGSPSIKNPANTYNQLTFRSVTFEMSTYRPFRFAAQVNGAGDYVNDNNLTDNDTPEAEKVSNVSLNYSAESDVFVSFDVTSFKALDGASVDPFGTGFEIYIDAPMLKLVEGDNDAIEGETVAMFEKNADGSLPSTIPQLPKLQDLGDGRFVYRVDPVRSVEAAFWNGSTPKIRDDKAASKQAGERKTIRFRTNSIVSNGDIKISSNQEQVVYHSKTFKLTNTPMTGQIFYSEGGTDKNPIPANQFVTFTRVYDGSRIGSMTITSNGNYSLRLRKEYEFYWRNDPIELIAHIDDRDPSTKSDYYGVVVQDLATLSTSPDVVLVRIPEDDLRVR